MEFATFDSLLKSGEEELKKRAFLEARQSPRIWDTFLSHSSADDQFLIGIIRILEKHGARIYTDDGDKRLPAKPSPDTARILKATVNTCNRMVLFLTPNSKSSKWIPWELGLGDGMKNAEAIALFPSAERSTETDWATQEYLGLYQKIVWWKFVGKSEKEWIVYNHHTNRGIGLREWLIGNR